MSWDWVERDLTEWAKRTLPEFLLISMQDPSNKDDCIARTPWNGYSVCVAEVQIDGEACLAGKRSRGVLQFELDIGLRLDIEREGETEYWPGVLQLLRFEPGNLMPRIVPRLEELPRGVAQEVAWFVQEGMARRYIWHALARWHAYALRKWTQEVLPAIECPYSHPEPPPLAPPFALAIRPPRAGTEPAAADAGRAVVPIIGKKLVVPAERSQPLALESDRRQLAGRFPFLPSMLAGVGGPANSDLRPDGYAGTFPDWFEQSGSRSTGSRAATALTAVDAALEQVRQRRQRCEAVAPSAAAVRAAELCEAIERRDIMRAFSKLDDETVNCQHPETGRYPVHYCVLQGSRELLQMLVEGQADVNRKDACGQTPLMAAAKAGNRDLVQFLLDSGANAAEQDDLGRSAAELVALGEPPQVDARVLRSADWREKLASDPAQEAIVRAATAPGVELRDLIDTRERPSKYGAVLLTALSQREAQTASASIEAGADVNATDSKGDTPLLLLVKAKWKDHELQQVKLARKLCRAGAEANARNDQGSGALHFAAHRGQTALVEELLGLRADASIANNEGSTALMYAAHGGHEAVCGLLLKARAPIGAVNRHGLTAAETARRRGFVSCTAFIEAFDESSRAGDGGGSSGSGAGKSKDKGQPFDYSKWNTLEKEMQVEEDFEEGLRIREAAAAARRPAPKLEDLSPEAFGLPADTPWPPADPYAKKGPFDYRRWDKIVDDIEKKDHVQDRFEELQKNPKYEYRDGQKMQVIF